MGLAIVAPESLLRPALGCTSSFLAASLTHLRRYSSASLGCRPIRKCSHSRACPDPSTDPCSPWGPSAGVKGTSTSAGLWVLHHKLTGLLAVVLVVTGVSLKNAIHTHEVFGKYKGNRFVRRCLGQERRGRGLLGCVTAMMVCSAR